LKAVLGGKPVAEITMSSAVPDDCMLTWALASGRQVMATFDTTIVNEMSLTLTVELLLFDVILTELVTLAADAEPTAASNTAEEIRASFIPTPLDISGSQKGNIEISKGNIENVHHLIGTPSTTQTFRRPAKKPSYRQPAGPPASAKERRCRCYRCGGEAVRLQGREGVDKRLLAEILFSAFSGLAPADLKPAVFEGGETPPPGPVLLGPKSPGRRARRCCAFAGHFLTLLSGCIGRPQHGPVQHPQDSHVSRIGGVDAVNNQIGQTGNHQFPCVGRPPRPAPQGKSPSRATASSIRRPTPEAAAGLLAAIHATIPRKIIMRRLGPPDRHGWGLTIRSNAATTVS
jgi:hypothetical protein